MKILVTGAKGFIGRNLISELRNRGNYEILKFDADTDLKTLDTYTKECEFVFHLAGVNRSENEVEFMKVNSGLTAEILDSLRRHQNRAPILITSSTQALLDNPYGRSKKSGEELLKKYWNEIDVPVYIFRLQNVFGKWCRPNYNSVVATFCYNIANQLQITIHDRNHLMNLIYIDDVVQTFISAMEGNCAIDEDGFCSVKPLYTITLGEIADLLYTFLNIRENQQIPDMSDPFIKKLYSTYISYLPTDHFSYPLTTHSDYRGSFTEILKTPDRGQISVNVTKPGITKGNHWHQTKNEKFLVVCGTGMIRLRKLDDDRIIEYQVSGASFVVVDIPPGYIHQISNIGDMDLVTIMWANEAYDSISPDTYPEEV